MYQKDLSVDDVAMSAGSSMALDVRAFASPRRQVTRCKHKRSSQLYEGAKTRLQICMDVGTLEDLQEAEDLGAVARRRHGQEGRHVARQGNKEHCPV